MPEYVARAVSLAADTEAIPTPGANGSRPGPWLEMAGFLSLRSVGPTVIASLTLPGEYRRSARRLPAAIVRQRPGPGIKRQEDT